MKAPLRTTSALAWILGCALVAGCGASSAKVHAAKTSGYMTDFALVYSAALAATRDLYPHVSEDAAAGVIKTAWHPVRIATTGSGSNQTTQQTSTTGGMQSTAAYQKRFFIRFDVFVVGGKPWRVRVRGEASSYVLGEVPMPLKGAEIPHWLKGRTESLQVAIYERLEKHAVPLDRAADEDEAAAELDTSGFGDLPPAAAEAVARAHDAARSRDAVALRALMLDDFVWRDGEAPSADVAVAMWQADDDRLGALAATLEAGCELRGDTELHCPGKDGGDPAVFVRAGESWRLAQFAAAD